jgi:hypothetical protein
MSKSATAPLASDLRAYYRADEKRMARLSGPAAATVKPGARGRIHPEAIAKARGKVAAYTPGATKEATAAARARAAKVRSDLRAKGVNVGTRGPLPTV